MYETLPNKYHNIRELLLTDIREGKAWGWMLDLQTDEEEDMQLLLPHGDGRTYLLTALDRGSLKYLDEFLVSHLDEFVGGYLDESYELGLELVSWCRLTPSLAPGMETLDED